jgi:hypothetical protein
LVVASSAAVAAPIAAGARFRRKKISLHRCRFAANHSWYSMVCVGVKMSMHDFSLRSAAAWPWYMTAFFKVDAMRVAAEI